MRKVWIGVTVLAVLALGIAGAGAEIDARSGSDITVEGPASDTVFAAGRRITLTLNSTDDVFAAGNDISVRGAHADHLFAAGESLTFTDIAVHDVFAAGKTLSFASGAIADDLVAAGERVTLMSNARVDGGVVAAGRNVTIEGPVGGGLRAAGRTVTLDSAVTGDVKLEGDTIIVGPRARISGNLTHRGRNVQISPEAQVSGQTTALPPRAGHDAENRRQWMQFKSWMHWAFIAGLFLLGVIVAMAFPGLMNQTSAKLRAAPASSLGFGVVLACALPVLIVVLLVTVVGMPLAFLLMAFFGLMWPLALIGAAYALGMLIRGRVRSGAVAPKALARALWTLAALVLLTALGMIPIAGGLVWMIVYLFGLGAVAVVGARALARTPDPVGAAA